MSRKILAHASGVLSVVGVFASGAALLTVLGKTLSVSEFSISVVSMLLGLLAGVFSMYLVKFAKKLELSRRVFISYSGDDQLVAREVAKALRGQGARVWLDQERLKPGDSIRESIQRGIDDADTFIALLSGKPRPNLLLELGMAQARGLRVIPVLLADAELPSDLQGLRYIDLRDERQRGLEELVRVAT